MKMLEDSLPRLESYMSFITSGVRVQFLEKEYCIICQLFFIPLKILTMRSIASLSFVTYTAYKNLSVRKQTREAAWDSPHWADCVGNTGNPM